MVASSVSTLAITLLTILSGSGMIHSSAMPLLESGATIPVRAQPTVEMQIIAAPDTAKHPTLNFIEASASDDFRFARKTPLTRRYDAGAELPHFADQKINRDSNSVRSLRLGAPKRRGETNDPIATRLMLRFTGDVNSLDADLRIRGSVADAIGRQL